MENVSKSEFDFPALDPSALSYTPEDFRRRVGRFGLLGFTFQSVFWFVDQVLRGIRSSIQVTSWASDLVWVILFGVLYGASKTSRVSIRSLSKLDAIATIALGVWLTSGSEPMNSGSEVGMLFAITATVFIRSILVPSSWQRSLWIGALAAAPTGGMVWLRKGAFLADQSPTMISMFIAFAIVWLVIVVSLSAYTSGLIFGLHQHIRTVTQLGRYTIERKIGEGGMGAVYLGRHVLLRRKAAIKILRRPRPGALDLSRFEREVRITSSLSHPNTVTVLDYGWTDGGVFYYVMPYLDGIDLDKLVREYGRQPVSRVVHLLRQACGALVEAHGYDLIHRDIKPANLIVSERGGVPDVLHVVDFGLACSLDAQRNDFSGTPGYMAPELLMKGETVDARADLYALGAVAYWLLTGHAVFEGVSAVDLCMKHVSLQPEAPSLRTEVPIPPKLDTLVLDCLAKRPADRPLSAQVVLERLEQIQREACPFEELAARAFWAKRRLAPATIVTHPEESTLQIDLRRNARLGTLLR